MPYRREAEAVLGMWREIERSLAAAEPGSAEEERLLADVVVLRDEYQRLIEQAREHHREVPPPFPEPTGAVRPQRSGGRPGPYRCSDATTWDTGRNHGGDRRFPVRGLGGQEESLIALLQDSQGIAARIDEKGHASESEVGNAAFGSETRQVVILNLDASFPQLGESSLEIVDGPAGLGLTVSRASRALRDGEFGSLAAAELDGLVSTLHEDGEAQLDVIELAGGFQVSGQQYGMYRAVSKHGKLLQGEPVTA